MYLGHVAHFKSGRMDSEEERFTFFRVRIEYIIMSEVVGIEAKRMHSACVLVIKRIFRLKAREC